MNKLTILILLVAVIIGCKSQKKVTDNTKTETLSLKSEQFMDVKDNALVSKLSNLEVETVTERIEYYESDNKEHGSVKSVEKTTTKLKEANKDVSQTSSEQKITSNSEKQETSKAADEVSSSKPGNTKLMYLFGIIGLIVGVIIYIRSTALVSVLSLFKLIIKRVKTKINERANRRNAKKAGAGN